MSLGGGSAMRGRRRLGDITNVKEEGLVRRSMARQEGSDLLVPPANAKEYSKLLTENQALLRLLAERSQIIEHGNLELQKLQAALQRLQEQNWQLAQANSQMLADLNVGRDRIKVLQHELTCTKAALKGKGLKREITGGEHVSTDFTGVTKEKPMKREGFAGAESQLELCISSRDRPPKNYSRVASFTSTQERGENGSNNSRRSIRKPSVDLKPSLSNNENGCYVSVNEGQNRNLAAADVNADIREGAGQGCGRNAPKSNSENVKIPGKRKAPVLLKSEELTRSSMQRPSRRATIGVCYKEIPLNVKMRRDS